MQSTAKHSASRMTTIFLLWNDFLFYNEKFFCGRNNCIAEQQILHIVRAVV
jgi:hypothetical protein